MNTINQIARDILSIETLETRKSDSLDFHDLSVWQIKAALEAAFLAGRKSALDFGRVTSKAQTVRSVGAQTITKIRTEYEKLYGHQWPEGDDYLRELWAEARASIPNGKNKVPPKAVFERCMEAMRENHPF